MRIQTLLVAIGIVAALASCKTTKQVPSAAANAPSDSGICLTGLPAHEWLEGPAPSEAGEIRASARSSFAVELRDPSEHWYHSGSELIYCRQESWCIAESWRYAPRQGGGFRQTDHKSWVCVTGPNNSFKPKPLRGSA